MSSREIPALVRRSRVVAAQVFVSVMLIAGAAFLMVGVDRISRVWGEWRLYEVGLGTAALMAVIGALAPWLSRTTTVVTQRIIVWTAVVLAAVTTIGALRIAHLAAHIGVQSLVAAAILAEVGTRRRALAWFVWTTVVLTLVVVVYYGLVSPRPGVD